MTAHVTPAALAAYAAGGPGLDHAATWTLEVHLEQCAPCRARLAELGSAHVMLLRQVDQADAGS